MIIEEDSAGSAVADRGHQVYLHFIGFRFTLVSSPYPVDPLPEHVGVRPQELRHQQEPYSERHGGLKPPVLECPEIPHRDSDDDRRRAQNHPD